MIRGRASFTGAVWPEGVPTSWLTIRAMLSSGSTAMVVDGSRAWP